MESRCNNNVVRSTQMDRSMQIDRSKRLRAFRDLCTHTSKPAASRGDAHDQTSNAPQDKNGDTYTQALKRFTTFKRHHEESISKDLRKAEWQEENTHLLSASRKLEKVIQDNLRASQSKICLMHAPVRCQSMSVACRNHSTQNFSEKTLFNDGNVSIEKNWQDEDQRTERHATSGNDTKVEADGDTTDLSLGSPGLSTLEDEEKRLKKARETAKDVDASQILALRGLVAEVILGLKKLGRYDSHTTPPVPAALTAQPRTQVIGCNTVKLEITTAERAEHHVLGPTIEHAANSRNPRRSLAFSATEVGNLLDDSRGSRAAVMAQVLVQARTAQMHSGNYLAERVGVIESEVKASRKALALSLAEDEGDPDYSTEKWISKRVGICSCVGDDGEAGCGVANRGRGDDKCAGCGGQTQGIVVRSDIADRLKILKAEHVVRLESLRQDFLRKATGPSSAGSIQAALDKTGGWNPERHFRFTKVLKAANDALTGVVSGISVGGGSGARRDGGGLAARLRVALPGVSMSEVVRHENWHRLQGLYMTNKRVENESSRRHHCRPGLVRVEATRPHTDPEVAEAQPGPTPQRRARNDDRDLETEHPDASAGKRTRASNRRAPVLQTKRYKRALDELINWGKESLEIMRREEKVLAVRMSERRERDRRRAELNKQLREQREVREQHNLEHRRRMEQDARERVATEAAETARKTAEAERKREAVTMYRASLEQLRAEEAKVREAEERVAEIKRAERMSKNLVRIGFREEILRRKREEQERKEREAEALEAKRLEVLERLAASVPYADACANAEARLVHVTAATAAHFEQFSKSESARGHCPMFGYDSEKIFRNAKFRLGFYLREAGVAETRAARDAVICATAPRPKAPF